MGMGMGNSEELFERSGFVGNADLRSLHYIAKNIELQ